MRASPFERMLAVHRGPVIERDLLIVDPASAPAPRWSDSRRDVSAFLAACDLPLLQLRGGGSTQRRNDSAVRPWHGLSGGGTTPVDLLAGLLPRL